MTANDQASEWEGSAGMPKLALDSLTLTDTQPMDVIRAAQGAGFDIVSLWVQAPALYPSALLTAEKEAECARALADTDLEVVTLEVFDLHSFAAVETYREALERGARLGAQTALTINYSNPDRAETADVLAKFAEVAAEYGLGVNLEPVAGGHTTSLKQGAHMIVASGADVGITLDPWHLIGSGGTMTDILGIDRSLIRYVQLCDGPVPLPSDRVGIGAVSERAYPGEGAFPLLDMLRLVPPGVPVGIECPSVSRAQAGRTPLEQAREGIAAVRRTLALLD
jgi:sugar phosphate isomerase/epimerase